VFSSASVCTVRLYAPQRFLCEKSEVQGLNFRRKFDGPSRSEQQMHGPGMTDHDKLVGGLQQMKPPRPHLGNEPLAPDFAVDPVTLRRMTWPSAALAEKISLIQVSEGVCLTVCMGRP
jgi:hypothetical protein